MNPADPYIALVTGVSRPEGLGLETARQLTELGYRVLVAARSPEKVEPLAARIGAQSLVLDISRDAQVREAARQIDRQYGRLDVLVNNAGGFFDQGGQPLSTDMEYARQAFDTNLLGAWRMVMAFEPLLRRSEAGRIVQVSSGAGSFGDPVFGLGIHPGFVPVYSLTKLALNGLTVNLARQFRDSRIKINSVCPGFVATYPGTEQWGARPVADGARGIVWAATLGEEGPSGGFFRDGKPIAW